MYKSTKIGQQEWMTENLALTRFRNGDNLFHAQTQNDWYKAYNDKIPAYSIYQNRREIFIKYGYMYNWHAVNDERGLAPEGWHIPTASECKELVTTLGGPYLAGHKMKYTEGWALEGNGDNQSMWSARPGGSRGFLGDFKHFQDFSYWWTSTGGDSTSRSAEYFFLNFSNRDVQFGTGDKASGRYVRCIKNL